MIRQIATLFFHTSAMVDDDPSRESLWSLLASLATAVSFRDRVLWTSSLLAILVSPRRKDEAGVISLKSRDDEITKEEFKHHVLELLKDAASDRVVGVRIGVARVVKVICEIRKSYTLSSSLCLHFTFSSHFPSSSVTHNTHFYGTTW